MSKLQEKIEALANNVQVLEQRIESHAQVINKQADSIEQNKEALHRIISWVSGELGPDAVQRLADQLNYKDGEKKSVIIT